MSLRFAFLGEEDLEAALLLSRAESVSLEADQEAGARLRAGGFLPTPRRIECLVKAPFDGARLTHRHRRLVRSLRAWSQARLTIELTTLAAFGVNAFLEQVYRPIWLPAMYGLGMTPYDAHQRRGLEALLPTTTALAIVRDDVGIAGAALFKEGSPLRADDRVQGPVPTGRWFEGLIYFLTPKLRDCRRALMAKLADLAATRGDQWLSLGQDLPWCEAGYEGPLSEKLLTADTIVARGIGRRFHAIRPRPGEGVGLFTWNDAEVRLDWTTYGEPLPRGEDLRVALAPARRGGRAG